ncbi:MAG: SRPBCC domain-containing protein, partial [Pseudolabrys sp.]
AGGTGMIDISKFRPKTVYVTYIASTPEKVWRALTDPVFTRQYFFGFAVDVEPKIGSAFRLLAPDGLVHVRGQIVDWDPPRRFISTWVVEGMQGYSELPE